MKKKGCAEVFFIVSGCVLIGLIAAFFLWFGYQHLLWTYYQHIFIKDFEKYETTKGEKNEIF